MQTDNVQLAAYVIAKGLSVQGITFNARGFGVYSFPDKAQALEVEFANDAPVPCRTFIGAYKKLLRRTNELRQLRQVSPGEPRVTPE